MRYLTSITVASALFLTSCIEPTGTHVPEKADNGLSPGVTIMLQGFEGSFVSCDLGLEGADHATLVSNRSSAGDWERFTMFTQADGRVVLRAFNGKYVCADGDRAGLLVADRDTPGEWETFSLIPKDNGKVAIQTYNGSFVSSDYGLPDAQRGRLIGDRKEAYDWELFTIVPDTAIIP